MCCEIMNTKRKLYQKSKNNYSLLINEKNINPYLNTKKEIVLNLYIDKDYNKHLILSKKEIELKNNIYFETMKLRKNNNRSNDYLLTLNLVFTKLLNLKNLMYFLNTVSIDNKNYLEVVFI